MGPARLRELQIKARSWCQCRLAARALALMLPLMQVQLGCRAYWATLHVRRGLQSPCPPRPNTYTCSYRNGSTENMNT